MSTTHSGRLGTEPILLNYRPPRRAQTIKIDDSDDTIRFDGYLQYINHPDNPNSKFGFLPINVVKIVSRQEHVYEFTTDVARFYWRTQPAKETHSCNLVYPHILPHYMSHRDIELVLPNGSANDGYRTHHVEFLKISSHISQTIEYEATIGGRKSVPFVNLKVSYFKIVDD